MSWLDEARVRAQQIAGMALAPAPPAPHPAALNPTLRVQNTPTSGQREPIIKSGKAGANGIITVTLDPVEPGTSWLIDYLVVTTTSANTTGCVIYDSSIDQGHVFDGTAAGNSAVAFYMPPRKLVATRQLIAVWTGAAAGDTATLRCEYHVEAA